MNFLPKAFRAPELLGFLHERGITVTPREGTAEDIAQWVAKDKELVVLEVREGFGAALLAGEPARLALHSDGSGTTANRHADRRFLHRCWLCTKGAICRGFCDHRA